MSTKSFALLFSAWTVAVVAMLGSLFFSQVMEFVPCELCWYQRIAMYVLILITGGSGHYRSVFSYSISFAVIGWLIAVYHNLLHYEVIPETASPCMEGVSCSTVYIDFFFNYYYTASTS
jgi:disulfide bond formation protein DsbB